MAARFQPASAAARRLPVVAIVGRPNVSKSTLFNRLVGERKAIVERRRESPATWCSEAEWSGAEISAHRHRRHGIGKRGQPGAQRAGAEPPSGHGSGCDRVPLRRQGRRGPLDRSVVDQLRRAASRFSRSTSSTRSAARPICTIFALASKPLCHSHRARRPALPS